MGFSVVTSVFPLFLFLISVFPAIEGCRRTDSLSTGKIIGGEPVEQSQDKRSLASTVRLEYIGNSPYNPGGHCTGTLVGPNHVVTAAHCLRTFGPPDIYLGSDQSKVVSVKSTIHPQWGIAPRFAYDIGVISFQIVDDPKADTADHGALAPVRIATSEMLGKGSELILAGFGELEGGKMVLNKLYQVKTKVGRIDPETRVFDIEPDTGKGPCHGDSGGPAFLDVNGVLVLVGATSHNTTGDCDSGEGTYTDVTRYQGWIKCAFAEQKFPLEYLTDDASAIDCAKSESAPK